MKVKKVLDGTDNDQLKSGFMPVPYNVNFELFIMSKSSDDALQIVEQILPYFQPEYTVTLREVPELEIIRDVPIVLNTISYEDDYEGDFANRKEYYLHFKFYCKVLLVQLVTSTNVIRTVQVDQYANTPVNAPTREQRYTVTPNPSTATAQEFGPDDDNFGFNETTSFFEDSKNYNPSTGQDE